MPMPIYVNLVTVHAIHVQEPEILSVQAAR